MSLFLSLWIKLFFVLTPFFGLTMFLSMTEGYEEAKRRKLALSVAAAVAISCLVLFFAGHQIFAVFGITLDAFRIGAGILLMLSGISLVNGKAATAASVSSDDVAVVPLAIPIFVGPATVGTLLVLGAELNSFSTKLIGSAALLSAVACITTVLLASSLIKRCLGGKGIVILSKLTGLILAALSAQMIMTGIQGFLGLVT
jgi:multiple antibiotic resistance protein